MRENRTYLRRYLNSLGVILIRKLTAQNASKNYSKKTRTSKTKFSAQIRRFHCRVVAVSRKRANYNGNDAYVIRTETIVSNFFLEEGC